MDVVAKFAEKSPTLFKLTKLLVVTTVAFAAKSSAEKVIDKLAGTGEDSSDELTTE